MGTIGAEGVGKYNGRAGDRPNNPINAKGFYDTLEGVKSFFWQDDLAWDQDFETSGLGSPTAGTDQTYADNVDICYFCGHGSRNGPFFGVANHDDGEAKPTEVRLGEWDLEWMIFDCCETLAYDNGAVFQRWGWPVFRGLHYIFAFETVSYSVTERGKRFAQKLNQGLTVRDAWISACIETEGPSTLWAYIRAEGNGTDTGNDHWWGKGFVSSDPVSISYLKFLSGTC
jgi:hypothetical protein